MKISQQSWSYPLQLEFTAGGKCRLHIIGNQVLSVLSGLLPCYGDKVMEVTISSKTLPFRAPYFFLLVYLLRPT